jgi:hypothetical protein
VSWRGLIAAAGVTLVCAPAAARAQYVSRDVPRAGTVEIGATATWTGGRDGGSANATLTSNPTVSPNPLTLFRADSKVRPSPGVEGQIGVYLSHAFEIEGDASFSRPVLSVRLSGDFESAPDTTAEETLTHYLIGGSAVYHVGRGRLTPFVLAGAAYLRQLDAGAANVQNGAELHAGGGIKYWFGRGRHRSGLRLDARVSSRNRSAGLDMTNRATLPVVSAGFAVLF